MTLLPQHFGELKKKPHRALSCFMGQDTKPDKHRLDCARPVTGPATPQAIAIIARLKYEEWNHTSTERRL